MRDGLFLLHNHSVPKFITSKQKWVTEAIILTAKLIYYLLMDIKSPKLICTD